MSAQTSVRHNSLSELSSTNSISPERFPLQEDQRALLADQLALQAVRCAVDQKGLDARALDLRGQSDIADFFVIVSGTSERHVKGIADRISRGLKDLGQAPPTISGYEQGQWVLLDFGDVVVHIFYEPVRQYYEFDDLWKFARPMAVEAELAREMRSLRTGIYG